MSGEAHSGKRKDESWRHYFGRRAPWYIERLWVKLTRPPSESRMLIRGGLVLTFGGLLMLSPSVWDFVPLVWEWIRTGTPPEYEVQGLSWHFTGLTVIGIGSLLAIIGAWIGAYKTQSVTSSASEPALSQTFESEPKSLSREGAEFWRALLEKDMEPEARRDFESVGNGQLQPNAVRDHADTWLTFIECPEATALGELGERLKAHLRTLVREMDEPCTSDSTSEAARAAKGAAEAMRALNRGIALIDEEGNA